MNQPAVGARPVHKGLMGGQVAGWRLSHHAANLGCSRHARMQPGAGRESLQAFVHAAHALAAPPARSGR